MRNADKTKEQLIEELEALRLRIAELEKLEAEHKQMGNVLGQSIEQVQTLLEEAPIGICNTDLKGKITYVNKRFEEVSGYSRQEVVGKNGLKLGMFSAETLKLLGKRIKDKLMGEPPRLLEMQFKCKDGHWIWVAMEGKLMRKEGIPVGFQLISRDITGRKQAEEALQAEKNKLQSVIDAMEDGLTIQDMDYNIIYQNELLTKIFGHRLGEKCYRVYEGKEKLCDGCPVEKAFRDGKSHTSERRVVVPSGEVTFWENTANPIRDAEGRIASCLEITKNITERKQAEEALQESGEELRKMFESVTDGISVIDLNGVITDVNQKTVEMHGFGSKDELLGKSALQLVAPCDHERVKTNMRKALKQGTIKGVEYTLLRADGSEFPGELSTSALKDAAGNWVGHITISRDITERKRAGEALERQKAYFQQLFDNSPEGIALLDDADRVVQVNEGFEMLFGYRTEEIKGQFINDIIVSGDHIEEASALSQATLNNKVVREETVRKRKDGSLVDVSVLGYPIQFGNKTVGVYAIYSDITERKRAGEALERQKAYFQQLFDNSPEGIALLDDADRVVQVNKGFETLFGYQTEEVKGRFINEVTVPEDCIEEASALSRATLNGKVRRRETVRKRKDGSLVDVSTLGYPIRFGNKTVGVYAIYSDITERKQAEETLRESEEKYRTLFTESRDALFISSRDGKLIDANQSFLDLFSYTREEAIGLDVRKTYVNPDDRLKYQQEMEQKGAVRDYELKLRKKDGTEIDCLLTATARRTKDGSILGYHGFIHNITERKRAEEERREMEQKSHIASRLASVGEMASGIAHEINNPLTAVIGFAQLLMDADLPDDVKEDIGVIHKEAQRAAGVAKNLLTFARKQAPAKELTNMNSIIEGVLKLRAYEQKVNNIHVNTHLDPKLPEVIADYSQMQQVFINIILNAEAAILEAHNGGTLTVTTKKVNNSVKVSFTDSGPGIAKENLNRIFDPFFTTKEVGKGTGLGLSVCHGIVAEHGGRIYARSKLGNGATFVVELPINAH